MTLREELRNANMAVSKLEDRLEEVQANGGSMQQQREPNFFAQGNS